MAGSVAAAAAAAAAAAEAAAAVAAVAVAAVAAAGGCGGGLGSLLLLRDAGVERSLLALFVLRLLACAGFVECDEADRVAIFVEAKLGRDVS